MGRCGSTTGAGRRLRGALLAMLSLAGPGLAACAAGPAAGTGVVQAVGAESQYADVLAQVGGRYVSVTSVLDNPSTDPHAYEASPRVARAVSQAELVVQNGLGYDGFMGKIESATPSPARRVVVAQRVLGLPDATRNPHLWYDPATMPRVARAIAGALGALRPAHAAYFRANLVRFDASLRPWADAVAAFRARFGGVPVATTEPVADALLAALGARNLTPFSFQADVMNGTDPPPQDVSEVVGFLTGHRAKALCYNPQVTSSLTAMIRRRALSAGVPVVGVYETMPAGYHYQQWMVAEVAAITRAVAESKSTEHL